MDKELFHEQLKKHFMFRGRGIDNLPYLATPPSKDKGRTSLALIHRDLGYKIGAEIGVRRAGSAVNWLKHNPELKLICIDPWQRMERRGRENGDKTFEIAKENLAPYNVEIHRLTSMEALPLVKKKSLDFAHIDGNHEFDYCVQDIIEWSRKVRSGGMIIVHDYLHFHKAGVVQAVDAYTHCHNINPWYVTRDRLPTAFWMVP